MKTRSKRSRAIAVLASTAACLAAVPAVEAATPFKFADGKVPDLTVDPQGTAHVVWTANTGVVTDAVRYCRIPRGQRACQGQQDLASGNIVGRPHVFLPTTGHVLVAWGAQCAGGPCGAVSDELMARRSTDGGITFGAPVVRSRTAPNENGEPDDAVYGPGESISSVSDVTSAGAFFLNAPLAGPVEVSTAELHNASVDGVRVGLNGAQPVVVYRSQTSDLFQWRAYSGSGSLNSAGSWTPAATIESNAGLVDPALAGGGSGLFLIQRQSNASRLIVRRFTGTGFTDGVTIATGSINTPDLSQDGDGRLHAIWVDNGSPDRLMWRTSPNGANWGPPVLLAVGDDEFRAPHVGAAPDGDGFVVWDTTRGPSGAISELDAIPLEPFTGPGSGISADDPCKWPTCLPAGGKTSGKVGGKKVTAAVSISSCGTKRVKARLRKLKRRNGKAVVQKVVFQLGKKKKTDKRPPYAATFPLRGSTLGKRYTLTATVHMRIGGRLKKLKLSKRFYACPLG